MAGLSIHGSPSSMVQPSWPHIEARSWRRAAASVVTVVAVVASVAAAPADGGAQPPAGPEIGGGLPPWLLGVFALVAVLLAAGVGIRGRPTDAPHAPGRPRNSPDGSGGHALLAPLAGPSSSTLHLRATEGRLQGNRFEVGAGELRIGRDPSVCHIVLSDPSVSREHALVRARGGRVVLRNLSGTNPTWLNGRPVEEASLSPGDVVRISSSVFEVTGPDGGAGPDI